MADRTAKIREACLTMHEVPVDAGDSYYSRGESAAGLEVFWGRRSIFPNLFHQLDLTDTLELACGRGRHSAQIVERCKSLIVVDGLESNIEVCRSRFAEFDHVTCIANNGVDLQNVASDSLTAVFSYDAMVHFEAMDVIGYVREIGRVLKVGGRALLHYSANERAPTGVFQDDQGWRSFFSEKMMQHFADRANMSTLASMTMSWSDSRYISDAVSLLEKRAVL